MGTTLFEILMSIIGALLLVVGWFARLEFVAVKDALDKMKATVDTLPKEYISKKDCVLKHSDRNEAVNRLSALVEAWMKSPKKRRPRRAVA